MSDIDDVKRVLGEAEEYAAALDRREERKEVYLMVAKDILSKTGPGEGFFVPEIDMKADVIYQGMLKFVGDKT